MRLKKILSAIAASSLLLTLGVSSKANSGITKVNAEEKEIFSIDLTSDVGLPSSTGDATFNVLGSGGNTIEMFAKSAYKGEKNSYTIIGKKNAYMCNKTSLDGFYISSVSMTFSSGTSENVIPYINFSDTIVSTNLNQNKVKVQKNTTFTVNNTDESASYFNLYISNNYNLQITNLSIEFAPTGIEKDANVEALKLQDTKAQLAYSYTTTQIEKPIQDTFIYEKGFANASDTINFTTKNNMVEFEWAKATSSNAINTSSAELRFYVGHTLKISSKEASNTFSKIVFNVSGDSYIGAATNSLELEPTTEGLAVTYDFTSQTASEILFTSTKQIRILSIDVFFNESAGFISSYEYSKVVLRFGGLVEDRLWDALSESKGISSYGVCVAKTSDLNGAKIQDVFDDDNYNLNKAACFDASLPVNKVDENGFASGDANYVIFNAMITVPTSEIATSLTAVAYIVLSDNTVVFLQERTESVKSLARDYINNHSEGLSEEIIATLNSLSNK